MMRITESTFTYKGYDCITTFNSLGFRCGYVRIPKEHPLYRVDYEKEIPVKCKELAGNPLGKRSPIQFMQFAMKNPEDNISLEMLFDVHGSITYSGDMPLCEGEDLWFLGFDCGHCDDGIDIDKLKEVWQDEPEVQHLIAVKEMFPTHDGDVVRTLEYVQDECRSLVDQIINYINNVNVGESGWKN